MEDVQTEEKVGERIQKIFSENTAIMVATTGGEYSPWILGAYFGTDGLDIYLLLEKHGKTMANLEVNKDVAIVISQNDAMKDFLQGRGKVEILSDDEDARVRQTILDKMPEFRTYTPVSPVKVHISKFFVTSLELGWFPAKVLEN